MESAAVTGALVAVVVQEVMLSSIVWKKVGRSGRKDHRHWKKWVEDCDSLIEKKLNHLLDLVIPPE
jgi:hypothetical protein